jgi:hypothetical protein
VSAPSRGYHARHGTQSASPRNAILVPLVHTGGIGSRRRVTQPKAAQPRRLSRFQIFVYPNVAEFGAASAREEVSPMSHADFDVVTGPSMPNRPPPRQPNGSSEATAAAPPPRRRRAPLTRLVIQRKSGDDRCRRPRWRVRLHCSRLRVGRKRGKVISSSSFSKALPTGIVRGPSSSATVGHDQSGCSRCLR